MQYIKKVHKDISCPCSCPNCFIVPDDAAAGPGPLWSAAAAAAVAGEAGQAGPVPPAQDVRTGLREGEYFSNSCLSENGLTVYSKCSTRQLV